MNLDLAMKVALVAGASRGIGRAIALALAKEECRLVVCARGKESLDATVEDLRQYTSAVLGVVADVSTSEGAAEVSDAALQAFGGVDILVNNVGGSGARHFNDVDDADFSTALQRNLWPAFRLSRAVLPSLRQKGGGVIINIASIWGKEGGGSPSYNMAKAGLLSLTHSMARDLAADRVRVVAVAPGSILFPGGSWERRQQADPAGIADFVKRELPFGRFGAPEEVADVVTFLASPRAQWVTGTCITVDGGQSKTF